MENNILEKLAGTHLNHEHVEQPDLLLVFEARRAVEMRKKKKQAVPRMLAALDAFSNLRVRLYPAVMTVILAVMGTYYFTGLSDVSHEHSSLLDESAQVFSIRNSTISVISNTMLTSIPTLRN
jgi:hypothetical protein